MLSESELAAMSLFDWLDIRDHAAVCGLITSGEGSALARHATGYARWILLEFSAWGPADNALVLGRFAQNGPIAALPGHG